jgi:choice-of-anchor B domain-containing protein
VSAQQSQNITLLAAQNLHAEYTGCWPYIHTDGREYVAVGCRLGTAIVRLTDPANPVEVGFISGPSDGVREMEQYQTYLYVVANGANPAGIQVISMADPDNPVLVNTVNTITLAENVTIDTARGYLYTTETRPFTTNRGLHIFSLADPVNPIQIATYEPYSVHDITVKGTRGYACAMNEGQVHVLDLTNPATPVELASFTSALADPHTAWPSSDDRYLFVDDENLGSGRVAVYTIQNLNQISVVHSFDDLPQSSTHFPMVRGNFLFVAHYTVGARIYDITDPARPVEVAYYDTWPGDDGIFAGVYEAPPFYPSGIFTATDRLSGLYIFHVQPTYGIVRGTVRSGNKPLSGATVRVLPSGPTFVTGADGVYGLAPSVSGSVTLECSKFGSVTQTAMIAVAQGSEQTVNFTVSATGTGTVKGTARRASDQTVLAGADVTLEGTPVATVTSGMGKYTLQKVPQGSYSVRAEVFDLTPAATSIALAPHGTAIVDFALLAAPFYDDAETDRGWTLGAVDDDATAGRWIRAVPIGTLNGSEEAQPSQDHSPAPGTFCFVTGNAPAGSPNTQESVQGGKTTLISPSMNLSSISDPRIAYWLWSYNTHAIAAPFGSTFVTEISNDGGASWATVSTFMRSRTPWVRIELRVLDYFVVPGNAVRVRFIVENRIAGIVEAALDDFKFYSGASGALRADPAAPALVSAIAPRSGLQLRATGRVPSRASGAWELRLAKPTLVRADLFDIRGRLARKLQDCALPAGLNQIRWDGRLQNGEMASSGVYLLRIQANGEESTLKVVVAR